MALRFNRAAEERFLNKPVIAEVARITTRVRQGGDHEIRLSYGTAIEIYRDAFVLPETCKRVLTGSVFDPIFDLLGYGNERRDVLPAGLSAQDAKLEIIRLMTTWLYLHEQAHLLQGHGLVAALHGAAELLSNDGGLEDVSGSAPALAGRDAALRHAFELAADYEAITSLVMVESIGMPQDASDEILGR